MSGQAMALAPQALLERIAGLPAGWLGILSGERGAGKSTWCAALARAARERGLRVAGLLSPAVFGERPEGDRVKLRIDLLDLASGQRRLLAIPSDASRERHGMRWHFEEETLAWGNEALAAAGEADLVLIDELGPLELTHGRGLSAGPALLDGGRCRAAVVVIRPELLEQARARWSRAELLAVPAWE